MDKKLNIGLALSGGGVRAAIFHLGIIARLAKDNLLECTKFISTVSGGSLAVGLIHSTSENKWPSSADYLDQTVGGIRDHLLSSTVQWSYLWRSFLFIWRLFRGRAHILASVIKKQWGINSDINTLSESPRWEINATCFETGKNWRFSKKRMGDYKANYVVNPSFSIADAIAASAAVPGLIGPLVLSTSKYKWNKYVSWSSKDMEVTEPNFKKLHLWDGGVYDNLGVEALYKPSKGLRDGINFLIVSDASTWLTKADGFRKRFFQRFIRLVDIATDQVRSIRSRTLYDFFGRNQESGVFLRMGYTASDIYKQAKNETVDLNKLNPLLDDQVQEVRNFKTTLQRVSKEEFSLIYRHGYEVADATLCAYLPDMFSPVAYQGSEIDKKT